MIEICCGHTTEIMVNIKDQQYLTENCQNIVHKFLSVTLRNFRQGIFPKILALYFNHYISPFVGYWHRLENQEISLVKTIEHLSKAADYLFMLRSHCYLCCKTEHKTQLSFRPKTKDFEVFME